MVQNIYVLRLENNKYYVGFSENPLKRIEQHFQNDGAYWTKLHKPLFVVDIYYNLSKDFEDKYTKILMAKYGIDNVRGGSFCQRVLPERTVQYLKEQIKDYEVNQQRHRFCLKCGQDNDDIANSKYIHTTEQCVSNYQEFFENDDTIYYDYVQHKIFDLVTTQMRDTLFQKSYNVSPSFINKIVEDALKLFQHIIVNPHYSETLQKKLLQYVNEYYRHGFQHTQHISFNEKVIDLLQFVIQIISNPISTLTDIEILQTISTIQRYKYTLTQEWQNLNKVLSQC